MHQFSKPVKPTKQFYIMGTTVFLSRSGRDPFADIDNDVYQARRKELLDIGEMFDQNILTPRCDKPTDPNLYAFSGQSFLSLPSSRVKLNRLQKLCLQAKRKREQKVSTRHLDIGLAATMTDAKPWNDDWKNDLSETIMTGKSML